MYHKHTHTWYNLFHKIKWRRTVCVWKKGKKTKTGKSIEYRDKQGEYSEGKGGRNIHSN